MMDQLRAMRHFLPAANGRSFSAAARLQDVSVPAITKSIGALEKLLDIQLFERTTQGITLTADGEAYRESCQHALRLIDEADNRVRSRSQVASGTVVVGVQNVVARGFLAAELDSFHSRWPNIQLDLRDFDRGTEEQLTGVDVFLTLGWPKTDNLIRKQIGTSRFRIVAAPEYWRRNGFPKLPTELAHHTCFLLRATEGTVMDVWSFTKGAESHSLVVTSWLVTSNAHRDSYMDLVMAGKGVGRVLDWTIRAEVAGGQLICALPDWEIGEAPSMKVLYRQSVRKSPAARIFIDFVTERFGEIERSLERSHSQAIERPRWSQRGYPRASAALRGER
jgi:DNA-binding transcriptional LysR family regulator